MGIDELRRRWLLWRLRRAQAQQDPPSRAALLEGRALFEELGAAAGTPTGTTTEPADADGVPVEWLRPDGADDRHVMLYLHGGAFSMGSPLAARTMLSILLRPLGISGCSVGYRLAPEHPYPAAVDDAVTAYAWLLRHHRPSDVVVAGDSAGAAVAMAMLVAARDRGLAMPAATALTSPWVDLTLSAPSLRERQRRDVALTTGLLRVAADAYLGGASASDPLASPVFADLRGLPPLLVMVGTEELLHDDAITLADRARSAGVPVELVIAPGMPHCWTGYVGRLRRARQDVAAMAAFLGERLASSPVEDGAT